MGLWEPRHTERQLLSTAHHLKLTEERLKMVKSRLREIELQLMMAGHHLDAASERNGSSGGPESRASESTPEHSDYNLATL